MVGPSVTYMSNIGRHQERLCWDGPSTSEIKFDTDTARSIQRLLQRIDEIEHERCKDDLKKVLYTKDEY